MPNTNTTYNNSSTRNDSEGYVYDPKTGKWIPPSPSTSNTTSTTSNTPTAPTQEKFESVPSSSTGNKSVSSVSSKMQADKEYIEEEFNTLTGELVVTPSKKSIRLGVNDTINIEGIGSYLSGKYFVDSVKRTLNNSGYSQTLTVLKNGFGDSLKQKKDDSDRVDTVGKDAPALKVGDTVKIVGDAIYSNAHEGVKVPAWVKEKTLTVQQISSDGSRVLLMPIYSWTYVKYVQKA